MIKDNNEIKQEAYEEILEEIVQKISEKENKYNDLAKEKAKMHILNDMLFYAHKEIDEQKDDDLLNKINPEQDALKKELKELKEYLEILKIEETEYVQPKNINKPKSL